MNNRTNKKCLHTGCKKWVVIDTDYCHEHKEDAKISANIESVQNMSKDELQEFIKKFGYECHTRKRKLKEDANKLKDDETLIKTAMNLFFEWSEQ